MTYTNPDWEVLYGRILLSEEEPIRTIVNNRKENYTTGEVVFNFSDGYALHLHHKDIRMLTYVQGLPQFNNEMIYHKTLLDITGHSGKHCDKLVFTFTQDVTLEIYYQELHLYWGKG